MPVTLSAITWRRIYTVLAGAISPLTISLIGLYSIYPIHRRRSHEAPESRIGHGAPTTRVVDGAPGGRRALAPEGSRVSPDARRVRTTPAKGRFSTTALAP